MDHLTYEEAEANWKRREVNSMNPIYQRDPRDDFMQVIANQGRQMADAIQLMSQIQHQVCNLIEKTLGDLEFYRTKVSLLEKRCNELTLEIEHGNRET